jgi:hypothetical protein
MSTDVCDHEWREVCSKCKSERGLNQLGAAILLARIKELHKLEEDNAALRLEVASLRLALMKERK